MDMNTIYGNLTSVDIEEQKRIWDDRGKGYYGEYLLLTELYQNIQGQCKILMNLNVPAANGKTTEIDLLMIHETGLYVFEAKYYKGTIYGRYEDTKWTQYFRTQPNSHFHSPVKQNEYHIEAIKKLFPETPVYSFIVFTNNETDVKVTGWENTGITVCKLNEISWYISRLNAITEEKLSPERIEEIFLQLKQYSPMREETVSADGNDIPFINYVNQLKDDYTEGIKENRISERKKYRGKVAAILGAALILCAVVLGGAAFFAMKANIKVLDAQKAQQKAEQELAIFSKKFKRVEPLNGGDVKLEEDFLEVYDVSLEKSKDIQNMYLFSCKLRVNGAQYGIHINKNTAIIVQMRDGTVEECVFGDTKNNFGDFWAGPFQPFYDNLMDLPEIQIFTESIENIAYIKLTNVMICGYERSKDFLPGTEFELYSAE